ncbi:MAG: sugar phosphate isomerase/epimerase [Chloroflexi bacterium]|nr:sugar phosphate isomerase/epimerase [Chloroflexota bacterium]
MLRYSLDQATTINWTFEQDIRHFASLGVQAVSVQNRKLQAYGSDKGKQLLRDAGMKISALLSAGFFTLTDASKWPAQLETAKRMIGTATEIGAERLLLQAGPCGAMSYEEAEARFKHLLGELLKEAERHRMPLCLEPNNALRVDLGYIHSLHDGLDLADEVDSPLFTICFETSNMWIERRLYENIARRTKRIGLVQLNDVKAGTYFTPSRVPMGDGIIPVGRIVDAFEQAHYQGYYDIEIVGPEVERLGYEETIRRALEWVKKREGR